jgi:hypothetical protein
MRRPSRLLAALGVLALAGVGSASAAVKVIPTGPAYRTYVAPAGALTDAGEVSLGVNWKSGAVLFQGQLETRRILFDGAGDDTWRDVTGGLTGLLTLDAIAASDNATGRVFVSQLDGLGSLMAFTDDDGASWKSSVGSGLPAGYDHQSVGVGPYPPGSGPTGSYPNAVYYCSQETVVALCARSDDGGVVFGMSVAAWSSGTCVAIHGHIRVALDGTVYVPNRNCTGRQGLAVSQDAGRTFTIRPVPGSTPGFNGDPSFATGRDGTGYFGFSDGTGRAMVSVTRTHGATWTEPYDLGKQVGVVNSAFPETIAGDGDRAAVAFLGTKTPGDPQDRTFGLSSDETRYTGAEYHLYVATTYDRGRTWKTVDTTPKDPVQRGRICLAGTTCTGLDRNLLDFMDIQVDRAGRVLVGWSDGCTGKCVTSNLVDDNSFSAKGTLTRQSAGKGLFAKAPPVR